jgi:hypothetical protein
VAPDPVVSLSAFAYLFSEMVQYHQNRVDSISELERRLESTGYGVGLRVLELLAYRSREYKRETKLMNLLQYISTQVWKSLFGKAADSLERSIDHADEFMIVDYAPFTRYVVPDLYWKYMYIYAFMDSNSHARCCFAFCFVPLAHLLAFLPTLVDYPSIAT